MRYALILSGGKGVRFWPVSREQNPKQFLAMCSDSPIIEEAIRRVMPLVGVSRTYIAANAMHRKLIEACARRPLKMRREIVFFEPQSRNTLAPIAYLSSMIGRKDPQAVIAVFPADHFVKDNARFRSLIRRGMEIARRGFIVTLGIPPARPETGYGYIKAGPAGKGFCLIERFVEKPDIT
ncbi:MAG: sugar phosphate nucleotidyltransferase, partial [Candidatus Omnitrophica bacterium]|nr:sugar phosphate nucleotidyltransferase [Candidatus Omnitrophota bacterium]